MIMRYVVACDSSVYRFVEKVQEYLNLGYTLWGTLCTCQIEPGKIMYSQALSKYEDVITGNTSTVAGGVVATTAAIAVEEKV